MKVVGRGIKRGGGIKHEYVDFLYIPADRFALYSSMT